MLRFKSYRNKNTLTRFLADLALFEFTDVESLSANIIEKTIAGNFYYYGDTKWMTRNDNGRGIAPPVDETLIFWYIGFRGIMLKGKNLSVDPNNPEPGLDYWRKRGDEFSKKEGDDVHIVDAISDPQSKLWWPQEGKDDMPIEWGNHSMGIANMDDLNTAIAGSYKTNDLVNIASGADPQYIFTYCQYCWFKEGGLPLDYWNTPPFKEHDICNSKMR